MNGNGKASGQAPALEAPRGPASTSSPVPAPGAPQGLAYTSTPRPLFFQLQPASGPQAPIYYFPNGGQNFNQSGSTNTNYYFAQPGSYDVRTGKETTFMCAECFENDEDSSQEGRVGAQSQGPAATGGTSNPWLDRSAPPPYFKK